MHRILAEEMKVLYASPNSIDSIRAKMIWAAREASMYSAGGSRGQSKTCSKKFVNAKVQQRSSSMPSKRK